MTPSRSNFFSPSAPNRARQVSSRSPRGGGFTLIEVLATLLLLSIALPVIMKGVALSTSAASVAHRRTDAGALADSKLNELIATGDWENSTLQGDFGTDWPDYSWSAEINSWGSGQGVDGTNVVKQLDVEVSWKNLAGGPQSVKVSSLVYQTANATSGTTTGGTK